MSTSIGSLKSTAGTIKAFVEAVESKILGTGETLSKDPTSFVSLLLDQMGSINAVNFFEMLSIKQEAVKSTAKLRRSLVRYLNSSEFKGILGNPASYSFNIGFKLSDLISYSVRISDTVSDSGILYKTTINKDSIVALIDKPVFTFDNDIDIYTRESTRNGEKQYNFFAKYNPLSGSVYGSISNPFIKSFIQIVDGEKYFILNLLLKQYQRNYTEINSLNSTSNKYEFSVSYPNFLHAFEVMYKENEEKDWVILKGEPDGIMNKNGYNFSILDRTTGTHFVNIKFSRNTEYFSPVIGSSLKIVTYTTNGESGNFTIHGWKDSIPPIKGIDFTQDVDNPYEYGITKMAPLVTIGAAESSGGSNEKSIDELRQFVISKSDSKSITLTELEEISKSHNLRFSKERSDILDIYFRLSGVVQSNDIIVDSTSGLVELDLNKLQYSPLTSTFILSPKTLVKYLNEKFHLLRDDEKSTIDAYITKFNSLNLNISERELFFPFFMRIDLNSYVDAKVFDTSLNLSSPVIFEFFNENSTSEASIDFCNIVRNPMNDISYTEVINGKSYSRLKGSYVISCDIQIGDTMYDQSLDEDLIHIYIKLQGSEKSYIINNDNIIITKIDDNNKLINVTAEIFTDCGIDSNDKISLVDSSVKLFPRQIVDDDIYLIDSTVDLSINIAFKGTARSNNIVYDSILTNQDIVDGFNGVSAIYLLKDVKLIENVTNIIKPIIDVKVTRGERLRYTEDIPDTYDQTVFETDVNGEIIYVDVPLPNGEVRQVPKILHQRYEVKLDEQGEIIYKHRIGDFKVDENTGAPLYENDEEVVYIEARDFPIIDRIFSEYSEYQTTVTAFKDLVNKIKSFQSLCPNGTSGKLGILNTIGSGQYFFINRKTNIEESIDRLALSFHIGVKPDSDSVDNDILIETITSAIVSYIKENSTSTAISFMEMLDNIKTNNFGIKYFELYKVNNYDEGVCHSIYSKNNINNSDIVTIKNRVVVSNNTINFIPDIKVTIIS